MKNLSNSNKIAGGAVIAALVGTLAGVDYLDGRWNQAPQVQAVETQHTADTQATAEALAESTKSVWILRRDILYRELVWLRIRQQNGDTMTVDELRRMAELEADIERIDRER